MSAVDRSVLAAQILERLAARREQLREQWKRDPISNLIVDDLLPLETARALFQAFPSSGQLQARRNLRESRFVGERLEAFPALLRDAVLAFQSPRVIDALARLTDLPGLRRAAQSNACGISLMERGSFMNPHVNGSREPAQLQHQALSVLYYVTPDLRLADGGHLELWHDGPELEPTTILSKFNRLVVMATHAASWHSVSPIQTARQRCCIWSYYFLPYSTQPQNDNHVASYRGRPEQKFRDLLLRADTFARQSLYRFVLDRGWMDASGPNGRATEDAFGAPPDLPPSQPTAARARESRG